LIFDLDLPTTVVERSLTVSYKFTFACLDTQPTMINHTWTAGSKARLASTAQLRVPPHDPNFALYYYVGVHGFKNPASFELSATQYDPAQASKEDEKKVGGAGGHALSGKQTAKIRFKKSTRVNKALSKRGWLAQSLT
jgi:hypothetical protein